MQRTETDYLGSIQLPKKALYGIHAKRALENFPNDTKFHLEWYKAIGKVKLAAYNTYALYKKSAQKKYTDFNALSFIDDDIILALQQSAQKAAEGDYFDDFIVPAITGGAGTSQHMNVNEILANAALINMGCLPGEYDKIDPVEQANVFQSTNDVIPTSLKVAAIELLTVLETTINDLRHDFERAENKHQHHLRIGYTQMQEAVPTSFGRLFSTYNDALSRDWWRVSKCFERLKAVNLGGGAIGTGLTIPKFFIYEVTKELKRLTNLPLAKAENLSDATANLDVFVEVHAILKSNAVNLEKMVNDLRLLASDLSQKTIQLPSKQVGSSIMPGKVNPVIPEYVVSLAHKVYANDQLITNLSAQGVLELNAYFPVIGHALLESIKFLVSANKAIQQHIIAGLSIKHETTYEALLHSSALTTALIPYIGYHQAGELAAAMQKQKLDIYSANKKLQLIDEGLLHELLKPQNLLQEGYILKDIIDYHERKGK